MVGSLTSGPRHGLWVVLLVSLFVRGMVLVSTMEFQDVHLQPDSRMYLSLAEGIIRYGSFSYPTTPEIPDAERMPGYPLFLAGVLSLFGGSLLSVVVIQILIDSLSCVLIYRLGETLWKGGGLICGLLAGVNIGMMTYSHFVLSDSLFLLLFLVVLTLVLEFLRKPRWLTSAMLGTGIGVATLIRPVMVYFPLVLIPFLFLYLTFNLNVSWGIGAGKVALCLVLMFGVLLPWMARNHVHYGRYRLTAQAGEHLLQYIVPFTWQYSKGIPFIEGMKRANLAFDKEAQAAASHVDFSNPFEKSDFQVKMALGYLKEEPKSAIIKAWLFGMTKNLFAPAIIDLSYLLKIERPHFFYTGGKTLYERGITFLRSLKGWFGFAVLANMTVLLLARLIQVWGLILLMKAKIWEGTLFFLTIAYFLLVSGPVGYAKYRLPLEPVLIILLGIGMADLYLRLFQNRRLELTGERDSSGAPATR